jgi:cytochrome aa3-600 menaquinol oxidase subunit 1
MYTYDFDMGWWSLNVVSTVGGFLMGIGFIFQVWQIAYSIKQHKKDVTGDAWGGRTLEWSIPSPAPLYNFAIVPQVEEADDWWETKQKGKHQVPLDEAKLAPIHMPKNSGIPFIMSFLWFFVGFGFVWNWMWMAIPALVGVGICMLVRSFTYDTDYYISVDEIKRTEAALKGANV